MEAGNPQTQGILEDVAGYYSARLAEHGAVPRGVDWNGEESQFTRFEQLCRIINTSGSFSINDLGCGYGALAEFLSDKGATFQYIGYDVSAPMIAAAREKLSSQPDVSFLVGSAPTSIADFGVASGIFNVRLKHSDDEWLAFVHETLALLDSTSSKGFAFNCLTSYSDADKMREDLYYADPLKLFDFCKRTFSKNVALLHDYNLYEFTILVRK